MMNQTGSPDAILPRRSGRVAVPRSKSTRAERFHNTGPSKCGLTPEGAGSDTTSGTSARSEAGAGRSSCPGIPSGPRTTTCAIAAPTPIDPKSLRRLLSPNRSSSSTASSV
jgi:hypothetical protein